LAFGFFRSHELDWLFKRTLAVMSEHAAEMGECLAACARVVLSFGDVLSYG
jgi:hypothetical protein